MIFGFVLATLLITNHLSKHRFKEQHSHASHVVLFALYAVPCCLLQAYSELLITDFLDLSINKIIHTEK